MMRSLIKLILKNKRLSAYLRSIYIDVRSGVNLETTVAEIQPINCRKSSFDQTRLNLLVPALSLQHVFGGISTALSFFKAFGNEIGNLRIILTDQEVFRKEDNPSYLSWDICKLDEEDGPGVKIISAGNRCGHTLPVGPKDRFVATAWWTAVLAKHIQNWQYDNYGLVTPPKFVYLIQDFEPGFYPWSSRYALAESTYHNTKDVIALFNTGLLKSFFDAENYKFRYSYVFEPSLHPKLRDELVRCKTIPKEKRVIVYGRPSVERNAFQTIVMSLRLWVANNPDSSWEFVSAGELHEPVGIGGGKYLKSLGKLTLEEYATELSKATIGISLMVSPHPSYPPLEMAAFGVRTITNHYKAKNLSLLHANIISISSVDPLTLSSVLGECTSNDAIIEPFGNVDNSNVGWKQYLESNNSFDLICNQISPLLFNDIYVAK